MLADRVVPDLRRFFAGAGDGIVAAYLFGSVARGTERSDSDVDVGVVFAGGQAGPVDALDRTARLQDALTAAIGREVDLVPLNGAPPDLLHRVLRDRVLLHDGDHDRRIEFEVRARNEYFDIAPRLERYRREVLRRA
jgi:predicted nucleotidyltransferase